MCGRYVLHSHPEVVALQFALAEVPRFAPRYNIAPTMDVLIVKPGDAALAHWRLWQKFHNLRADTVQEKPAFRDAYRSKRCLIPANGFYEWQQQERLRKQPYYVRPAEGELFAFAGLWDRWKGRDTCAVITTEANETVRRIHDRMPAIIARENYARWLGGEEGLLLPAPSAAIEAYPVSMAVNGAANDAPQLIEPVASGFQRTIFD
jgi:putative SOS response-associated peptidase YedK